MSGILIRQGDGTWREAAYAGYALESDLQAILAEHPALIPGVGEGARTCREFPSEAGPADIVIVDAAGDVTLVECKLAANPQARREIIGQMFDYTSRLWKMDVEDFAARWQSRTQGSLFSEDSESGIPLREALARNLAEGRFRIVLAVDAINSPLKRMVEYLNFMSGPNTSVIAVEYSRLTQGSTEILAPRVYGQELAEVRAGASKTAGGDLVVWDAGTFRSWLESNDSASIENFDLFLSEASRAGLAFIGSRTPTPAAHLEISNRRGQQLGRVSLYFYSGQRTSLEFDFTRISRMSPDEKPDMSVLSEFVDQLGLTAGLQEVADSLRTTHFASRRPNVPLARLTEESIRQAFVALSVLMG
ncbi:hypothetical protein QFZ60_003076 [Arthrobacter sp. B2I5]|uniref:hypothetical protein n=1 Tax=Arthrobacter sp. B2I5 TaxID=3042266 RepID=UPI00278099E5|nr:hypothetical protein [Arthrobacter sp. B2I5]MDQ0826903.1 hypothetical protein [Arthrobacter sp. B2I5]